MVLRMKDVVWLAFLPMRTCRRSMTVYCYFKVTQLYLPFEVSIKVCQCKLYFYVCMTFCLLVIRICLSLTGFNTVPAVNLFPVPVDD